MFDGTYPLPHHAVAISLRGDGKLQVYMPGPKSAGHTVTITPDTRGMAVLHQILKERSCRFTERPATISGSMDAPTQQIVEEFLKANPVSGSRTTGEPKSEKLGNVDIADLLGKVKR